MANLELKDLMERINEWLNYADEEVKSRCIRAVEGHLEVCRMDESITETLRLSLGNVIKDRNVNVSCASMLVVGSLIQREINDGEKITPTTAALVGFLMVAWSESMKCVEEIINKDYKKIEDKMEKIVEKYEEKSDKIEESKDVEL